VAAYQTTTAAALFSMRIDRTRLVVCLLAAGVVAGCGGGAVTKPLADEAARSAAQSGARSAAREASKAADRAARSEAPSIAASSSDETSRATLRRLEAMWRDDEGLRSAICRRLDASEFTHSDENEREYLAYEAAVDVVIPYAEFLHVLDAVDQLSDGDAEWARTAACLP
jgi:hypothetical protein